jgi:hypothetical protein|tara:strand:- start:11 stop:112 length:102 start_codon:yes stop_codon:yes gene_type:complete
MSYKEYVAQHSDLNWDGQEDRFDDFEKVGENDE